LIDIPGSKAMIEWKFILGSKSLKRKAEITLSYQKGQDNKKAHTTHRAAAPMEWPTPISFLREKSTFAPANVPAVRKMCAARA